MTASEAVDIAARCVSEVWRVPIGPLLGRSREYRLAEPRHAVIAIARALHPKATTTAIAAAAGGRGHTMVHHSLKVSAALREQDLVYRVCWDRALAAARGVAAEVLPSAIEAMFIPSPKSVPFFPR